MFFLQKRPNLLIPFLTEHFFTIVGVIASFFVLLNKPSDEEDLFQGHKIAFMIGAIIGIAIICHSWFVIYALYQEYTILMFTTTVRALATMQPNIAVIESGYHPTYSRNKIGVY